MRTAVRRILRLTKLTIGIDFRSESKGVGFLLFSAYAPGLPTLNALGLG